jgi:hypothetical protein
VFQKCIVNLVVVEEEQIFQSSSSSLNISPFEQHSLLWQSQDRLVVQSKIGPVTSNAGGKTTKNKRIAFAISFRSIL